MPATRAPTYRLHKPTGQAVVTLNSKDFYLGRHDTAESREAYDRVIAEWLTSGRQLPSDFAERRSVNEIMAAYWQHAAIYYVKNGEPTSEQACIRHALRHVRRLYGRTAAADFGPLALKAVRQAMVDAGMCRNVVNRHVGRVKQMFKWAAENELVPGGVHQALTTVRSLPKGRSGVRETEPTAPVCDEHVEAVRCVVSPQVWAIIQLQRLTGMRSGEVVTMRASDIDMTGRLWLYQPATHKNEHRDQPRVVEIGPKAQEIIRPFLTADLTAYLFSPADAMAQRRAEQRRRRRTPLTPSQRNRRPKPNPRRSPRDHYDRDSYRRAIQWACDKAGIPRWHPHQLRHSFATRIRKEYGIEAARILLGHRSPVVTEVYAEVDRTKAAEIMARVG